MVALTDWGDNLVVARVVEMSLSNGGGPSGWGEW